MTGLISLGTTVLDLIGKWTEGEINNTEAAAALEKAAGDAVAQLRGLRAEIAADRREVDAEIARLPKRPTLQPPPRPAAPVAAEPPAPAPAAPPAQPPGGGS